MAIGASVRVCRVCGASAASHSTGRVVRGYSLVVCLNCGILHVDQRPAPSELKRIYERLFAEGEYEVHRREFEFLKAGKRLPNFGRPRLLRRAARLVRGRRLIEIGGGTGKFGLHAKRHGWEYIDYDISEVAVEFSRRLGLDARTFVPTELPPLESQSADLVVMWEVLEHLWNVKEYLDVVRAALRPGGALLLSTPNYHVPVFRDRDDWGLLSSPPIHLTFFTHPTLKRTLHASGFTHTNVFFKRWYPPRNWHSRSGWTEALRLALLLDEPDQLYAIAQ